MQIAKSYFYLLSILADFETGNNKIQNYRKTDLFLLNMRKHLLNKDVEMLSSTSFNCLIFLTWMPMVLIFISLCVFAYIWVFCASLFGCFPYSGNSVIFFF